METLKIADKTFTSRLFTGTGKFSSNQVMEEAIIASESQLVTVAMKRIRMEDKNDDMLKHILRPGVQLLPNTSGVRDAKEAIFAAQLSREAFGTNWLKLEIHPDPRYLLPDPVEFLRIIIEQSNIPVVVDAGIGAPSHAAEAMELGADAVLVNTAIAVAGNPVEMAKAFKVAVEAGRMAYEAGLAGKSIAAEASSPLTAFLK